MNGLFDFSGMSAVVYKELRQILRSPVTLALAIGVPLVQMLAARAMRSTRRSSTCRRRCIAKIVGRQRKPSSTA